MAGWLTHLRTAEAALESLPFLPDLREYYIGTVAVDCGKVLYDAEGKRYYSPPRHLTHWTAESPEWDTPIRFFSFYQTFLEKETEIKRRSFYMGYYIHLITDALWRELVRRPVIESFADTEEYNKEAREIQRAEWYWAELAFLKGRPDYEPLRIASSVRDFQGAYLPFLSSGYVQEKLDYLAVCYQDELPEQPVYQYMDSGRYEAVMKLMIISLKVILCAQ